MLNYMTYFICRAMGGARVGGSWSRWYLAYDSIIHQTFLEWIKENCAHNNNDLQSSLNTSPELKLMDGSHYTFPCVELLFYKKQVTHPITDF